MRALRLKLQLPIILATAAVGAVIYLYFALYESKYITVKLSGDAYEFEGFINYLNDKGEIEGLTLESELPQEHRIKTKKLFCKIELTGGEYIYVQFLTKGELIREDTVFPGLYRRNIDAGEE